MEKMQSALKAHVIEAATDPSFVHHRWFVKRHLEIVAQIAQELLDLYPRADAEVVRAMVWLHDYGKILNFNKQYDAKYVSAGRDKMIELGFDRAFAQVVADNIARTDTKKDLGSAPIEVQILASADGCSHLAGPFMRIYWWEHPEQSLEDILTENVRKLTVDWRDKVVLPEARQAFQARHDIAIEQSGQLPEMFNL